MSLFDYELTKNGELGLILFSIYFIIAFFFVFGKRDRAGDYISFWP